MKKTKYLVTISLLSILSTVTRGQVITFEPNSNGTFPDGSIAADNMVISNQFLRMGVTFSLDNDMNGIPDPDNYPRLEKAGYDSNTGFEVSSGGRTEYDYAENGTSGQLGQYFLRTHATLSATDPQTLLVSYVSPVKTASGEIWDIDGGPFGTEQWRIEALNAEHQVITNILTPEGINPSLTNSLDGLPYSFEIHAGDVEEISSLRFVFTGTKTQYQYVGLAFNNFSPVDGLGTTNVIGVAEINHAIEIFWHTQLGKNYQLQWTRGLGNQWQNIGAVVVGTGVQVSVFDSSRGASKGNRMYRVLETD